MCIQVYIAILFFFSISCLICESAISLKLCFPSMQALQWWLHNVKAIFLSHWREQVALHKIRKAIVVHAIAKNKNVFLRDSFRAWWCHVRSNVERKQLHKRAMSSTTHYRLCVTFDTWYVLFAHQ